LLKRVCGGGEWRTKEQRVWRTKKSVGEKDRKVDSGVQKFLSGFSGAIVRGMRVKYRCKTVSCKDKMEEGNLGDGTTDCRPVASPSRHEDEEGRSPLCCSHASFLPDKGARRVKSLTQLQLRQLLPPYSHAPLHPDDAHCIAFQTP
jgi:hypothetical protein